MLAELIAAVSLAAAGAPPALPERIEAGRSVQGRRIVAVRRGPSDAPVKVLVSGSRHGTELAGHAVIRRIRPQLSIHFHQALGLVTLSGGARPQLPRDSGRRTGLPARTLPAYRGTSTSWQNHTFEDSTAFVVELAAGPLTPQRVQRHARAVLGVAASLVAGGSAAQATPGIRWSPIPFGADRRRQMRAYARRHYGLDTARLEDPKVIVEHFTASRTAATARSTGSCRSSTCAGTRSGSTTWPSGSSTSGHAESLGSPYHRERVARLRRRRPHGDFAPATVRRHRARL